MLRVGISPEFNWDYLYSNNPSENGRGVQTATGGATASADTAESTVPPVEDTQASMVGQWVSSLQSQARTPAQQYAANTGKDPELGSYWGTA